MIALYPDRPGDGGPGAPGHRRGSRRRRRSAPPRGRRRPVVILGGVAVAGFVAGLLLGLASNWFDAHGAFFLGLLAVALGGWVTVRLIRILRSRGPVRDGWRDVVGAGLALSVVLAALGRVTTGVILAAVLGWWAWFVGRRWGSRARSARRGPRPPGAHQPRPAQPESRQASADGGRARRPREQRVVARGR